MPYKYPKKKPTKKYVKKKKTTNVVQFKSNAVIGRGFPKKMATVHKFVYNGTLQSTTGTIATEQFYVNRLDQPIASGATHQPLYYDQMNFIYNNSIVIGSKINFRITQNTAGSTDMITSLFLNDYLPTVTPTTITAMQEQTGSQYRILGSAGDATQYSDKVYSMKNKWSAKKRFGGSVMANDNLWASTGPNFTPAWVLALAPITGTATVAINYTVTVEYITVWFGIRDIDGS